MQNSKNKPEGFENSLQLYMLEVSDTELLSKEEEQSLIKKMYKWSRRKRCSPKVEKEGREARDTLIKANLRLVIKIAKEFRNVGLDYDDLINEGNIGLMSAIDKYDLEKGAKLSYYASFWIKQSIRRAISNKGRTIRLPVGVVELKLKINKYIDKYQNEQAQDPAPARIAEDLNITVKKVEQILNLNFQTESLNEHIGQNDEELGSVIPNKGASNPFALFTRRDDERTLNDFLNGLDFRQRYIIIHRFGLRGVKPQTLEVIGNKFDLTRERIRQLELCALKSLREMYKKIDKNKIDE